MKNIYNRCRRHYSMRQRFFIKRFFQNAFLLLIPIFLIGPYSIYQINKESRSALEKNSYGMLYQIDETMKGLLEEMDNVYYYIRSNPSITTSLKNAYNEPQLTLNNLRNINNICSLLRYYMYTSEYIETIYVYYYNSNNRILVPEKGMISRDAYKDTDWIEEAKEVENDIWLNAKMAAKDKYSIPVPILYYFRKIYSTIDPSNMIGVIAVEYDGNAINRYINSLSLYPDQTIAVVNKGKQILLQNNEMDFSSFLEDEKKGEPGDFDYYDMAMNEEKYTVSKLQSQYIQELEYVSVVPTKNVLSSSNQFARVFLMLTGGAIAVSVVLAAVRAKKDYKNLESILELLSHPEKALQRKTEHLQVFSDPYSYITYNIINLFIRQDYLNVQTSEQKYKLQALELSALQQQINPHFLHNTLNTIYWEAIGLTKGPNVCSEMLTKLASIMRYSLGNPDEIVTMKDELDYLKSYVYIQEKRYNYKFHMEYDIDENVFSYPIRKMILQPLVENSISHGIKSLKREGVIRLKIHRKGKGVYVSILDNGIGMSAEQIKELKKSLESREEYGTHVGLANVDRRLVLAYGKQAELHIVSRIGQGTCVYFRIP